MALIEVNWKPSTRELRHFACIWFPAFFGLVGALLFYRSRLLTVPAVLWSVAFIFSLIGLIKPSYIRPTFLAWMWAVYPVGWTVSHLMLAAIFFLFMTPVGMVMRLFGYDPMKSRFDGSATTYWVPHNPGEDAARYFRQF